MRANLKNTKRGGLIILETCIREIYLKLHPNKRSKDNVIYMDLWKVKQMIREVSKNTLKKRLDEMYDKLGNIIHGHKTVGRKGAKESFRDTLKLFMTYILITGIDIPPPNLTKTRQ